MSEEKDDSSKASHDNGYIESVAGHPTPLKNRYHFDQSDLDRVQRRLKQRHVQMFVLFFLLRSWSITLIPVRFHRIAVSASYPLRVCLCP